MKVSGIQKKLHLYFTDKFQLVVIIFHSYNFNSYYYFYYVLP
jgi:hypothetical protein